MSVTIYTRRQIERIAAAASIAVEARTAVAERLARGATNEEADAAAAALIRAAGAEPAYDGYHGFSNRAAIISVNEQVCNAVATPRRSVDGDVMSISAAVRLDGFHAKSEETYCIGTPSVAAARQVTATYESLRRALDVIRPGARIGDIGAEIKAHAEHELGLGVIEAYCGHGIGERLHEEPQVSCVGRRGTGRRLVEGMVLYVMVMLAERSVRVDILEDGWTAVTKDGGLATTAARMIAVGPDGPLVMPELRPPGDNDRTPPLSLEMSQPHRPWYLRLFSD